MRIPAIRHSGVILSLQKRATAEFVGTFWLVFGGCGSAVLAAAFPNGGIGLLGVAFAFGLTVLTMASCHPVPPQLEMERAFCR